MSKGLPETSVLKPGAVFNTAEVAVSAQDIIDYARDFDPQPYHLDPVKGEQSIFGGHCASGWQMCVLISRLVTESLQHQQLQASGCAGISSLRWHKPVFAGDVLAASVEVTDRQADPEHAGYELLSCHITGLNQQQQPVVEYSTELRVLCDIAAGGAV